jgi:hypothetical protein
MRMRLRGVVATVCAALIGAGLCGQSPPRNLLVNPGFEDGLAGWRPDAGHQRLTDAGAAHTGTACVTGEVTAPQQALQLKQAVRVKAGCLYEFGIWARATNRTKLVLWAVPPGETQRVMIEAWENVPAPWTRYTVPVPVAADGELDLHLIAPSSHAAPAGRIWVDDAALYETTMPRTWPVSGTEGFNDEPALAVASDGSAYVAWVSFRDGSDTLQVARFSRSEAGEWLPAGRWQLAGGRGTYVLHPLVVAVAAGVMVLWSQEMAETDWEIRGAPCTAMGPGEAMALSRLPGIDMKPAAAWSGTELLLAWEANPDSVRRVCFARWDGRAPSAPETLSTGGGSNYEPSIAVAADGRIMAAWHAFREHNYDLYARTRQADGGWGPEVRITRSPGIDRHAALFARGTEIWLTYEHAETKGYRIGATSRRSTLVGQLLPDGQVLAPRGLAGSCLGDRSEGAAAAADTQGRVWVAHLQPQGQRNGWQCFFTGYAGDQWTPARRLVARIGMDRRPGFAIAGGRALVACQVQPPFRQFRSVEDAAGAQSEIVLAEAELEAPPAAGPLAVAPLAEPTEAFEAAALRQAYGDHQREVPAIDYLGQRYLLAYGDLHEHTELSQCNRHGDQSSDESYQHMRDIVSLDFAAATDHGYNLTPYLWNYTAKMVRTHHDPGRFVTFLGEEWTSSFEEYSAKYPYGFHGHRNLILADPYFAVWWNEMNRQTPADVWRELRERHADFVHIPHQVADTGNVPCNWEFTDETAQPVAEIFQVRGSYECKDGPREAARSTPAGWFLQDAWARGTVIGVIASPDHGGGLGKACVYTRELTRAAILEAIRARRCFATTAARMLLDVRVNGHLMGEKAPAAGGQPVTVEVNVRCPGDIARIEVCRNNRFIYSRDGDGPAAAFTFTDAQPLPERSYYYVRVLQRDQEIGWSSPVWLGFP